MPRPPNDSAKRRPVVHKLGKTYKGAGKAHSLGKTGTMRVRKKRKYV
jgi:hypothetical protein